MFIYIDIKIENQGINYPLNLINHHLRKLIAKLRNFQGLEIILLFIPISFSHEFNSLLSLSL